jgi:arylsulfatase A-like enzyme
LLTVGWSPLYKELTNVPLIVRAPGLEPGRRSALTSAPDLAPTILELAGVERPQVMQGESFGEVLRGEKDEHRPFIVSSWPLYFAAGEFTTAIDSRSRRIASYMPMTVSTRERSLILGGPAYMPELYDLGWDPDQQSNVWESRIEEGAELGRRAISFLEQQGTPELYLTPRRLALQRFAPDFFASTLLETGENQMHNTNEEAV